MIKTIGPLNLSGELEKISDLEYWASKENLSLLKT